jgi:hypothetical protein
LRIVVLEQQGAVRVWTLPVTNQFRQKHLDLELDVRTGTQLKDRDELEVLSPETWRDKEEVYDRSIASLGPALKAQRRRQTVQDSKSFVF